MVSRFSCSVTNHECGHSYRTILLSVVWFPCGRGQTTSTAQFGSSNSAWRHAKASPIALPTTTSACRSHDWAWLRGRDSLCLAPDEPLTCGSLFPAHSADVHHLIGQAYVNGVQPETPAETMQRNYEAGKSHLTTSRSVIIGRLERSCKQAGDTG